MDIQPTVRRRWTHTESFKQTVIYACQRPGATVAGVALAHSNNANQVRRWIRQRGVVMPGRCTAPRLDDTPAFVPMPPTRPEAGPIVIKVRLGTTAIHVEWPVQAADCEIALYLTTQSQST